MAEQGSGKTKKILLGVGGGCLGIVLLCCLSGLGGYFYRQSSVSSAGQEHAELFLRQVQAQDWASAFVTSEYEVAFAYRTADELRRCYSDTALGDISAFECDSAEVDGLDDGVDVGCTVTSASRGAQDITIHVNSASDTPYLGFTWFATPAAFGPTWAGDECTTYSGREFFEEPPAGRVRPPRSL